MIFPKQTKSREGISTNGTDPEEFKQKYCMNEVRTKAPVCLKRKVLTVKTVFHKRWIKRFKRFKRYSYSYHNHDSMERE